jgi:hypothetical protein
MLFLQPHRPQKLPLELLLLEQLLLEPLLLVVLLVKMK